MIDFVTWCKNHNLDFGVETPEVKKEGNSTKRAGVRSHAYPELYSRGQYPKSYMRPIAADAVTYQDIEGK